MDWKTSSLMLMLLAAPGFAWAGDHGRDHDHDRARRAVEEGRCLPLRDILARAEAAYPGQLIEAELEDGRDGRLYYELKLLAKDGRLMKLIYDAGTGELVTVRERERP